jgi:hypothetical protein
MLEMVCVESSCIEKNVLTGDDDDDKQLDSNGSVYGIFAS